MYGELHEDVFSADLKPALETLEALRAANTNDPAEPERVPMSHIELVPHVFQVRGLDFDEHHVGGLLSALKQGVDLDPITVWRCGKHVLLVDGHHRKAAYERYQLDRKVRTDIPVRWFHGTAKEAMKEAAQANVKLKLPMTPDQRNNLAWRLTLSGGFSKAETATLSGVSERQVANMRQVVRKLGSQAESCETWRKALRLSEKGKIELSDEELEAKLEAQVEAWAFRLSKAFGNKLQTNPDLAARVFDRYLGRAAPEVFKSWYNVSDCINKNDVEELINPEF
jgi:ParB-like chromosome segregation protein Spo0J